MKPSEYYDDMKSTTDCIYWAESVGLKWVKTGGRESELFLPGSRGETHVSFYYDMDEDDLDLINCMNRLRRWKEDNDERNNDT